MRIAILSSLFMFSVLYAKCDCLCVNGNVEAICSNAYEVRPVCNPRVCPIVPPSIEPLQTPKLLPLGTLHVIKHKCIMNIQGSMNGSEFVSNSYKYSSLIIHS